MTAWAKFLPYLPCAWVVVLACALVVLVEVAFSCHEWWSRGKK